MTQYAIRQIYEITEVHPDGSRTPTGHHVEFNSIPADKEATTEAWFRTLQLAVGCGCEEQQTQLGAVLQSAID